MSPRRRLTVTLLALFPWAVLLFQLLLIVPRNAKLFADHRIKVPELTRYVIDVSVWASAHQGLAFLATLLGMAISVGLIQVGQTEKVSRRTRVLVLLTAFGVPCLLFALAWLGVDVAHRRLDEGLSQ
jgi:type II secretory pathway component PulF